MSSTTTMAQPRTVLRAAVDGIPGAYVLVSAGWGERDAIGERPLKPIVSLFYDADGKKGAEWCPPYGPIQLWTPCEADHPEARPHYFYPHVLNRPLDWSQRAVDNEGLPGALVRGDARHVFAALRAWARRDMYDDGDE